MKPLLSSALLLFLLSNSLFAAIDPVYKECVQRGYSIDGDYCVFTDQSKCLLDSFNAGVCGQEWMTDDYCVSEGDQVWDADRCCDGLLPYLPEGHDGQSTCQSEAAIKHKDKVNTWLFWGALIAVIVATFLYSRYNRKRT